MQEKTTDLTAMDQRNAWDNEDKQLVFYLVTAASNTNNTIPRPPSTLLPRVLVPRRVADNLRARGFEVTDDGIVRWGKDSLTHPRRWPLLRKVYDSAITCFLEFFMTLVSNTGSSIAPFAAQRLSVSREMALFCFTTAYLIGQAIGGLIFPPIAESYGCRTIYLTSTFGFALFCVLLAAYPTLYVVLVCRFMTGLLSAMPSVVATGNIENMWDMTSRTFVIHIWICAAVVGLALGPPVATYISTSELGWVWVFNISAIVSAAGAVLCFGMSESRPCQVLRQEVKTVAKEMDFDGLSVDDENSLPTLKAFVKTSLILPIRLFFTEPIVWLTSVMAATVYGIVYLFSESLSVVYVDGYGFGTREASLVILAVGVGVFLSFLPRIYDVHVVSSRRKQIVALQPEDKLFGFYVAAPVLAAGLWWFAWTVPPLVTGTLPWVSIASLVLVGFSVVEFDNVLCGYLCDTYASYAGSANAPMAFLRAMLSGCFPLFGHQLFHGLGANNALFILASVATAYCGVAFVFGRYGRKIRERSPFAEKVWTASQEDFDAFAATEWTVSLPGSCHPSGAEAAISGLGSPAAIA